MTLDDFTRFLMVVTTCVIFLLAFLSFTGCGSPVDENGEVGVMSEFRFVEVCERSIQVGDTEYIAKRKNIGGVLEYYLFPKQEKLSDGVYKIYDNECKFKIDGEQITWE